MALTSDQMAFVPDGSTRRVDGYSWRSHEVEPFLLWEVKRIWPDVGLVSRSHRAKACSYVLAQEETRRNLVLFTQHNSG